MNFIAFRVTASYNKFKSYHILGQDLNLAIVTAKYGHICEKKISVTLDFFVANRNVIYFAVIKKKFFCAIALSNVMKLAAALI